MADTKRTREEKHTGKDEQGEEWVVEEELDVEAEDGARREDHDEDELDRELGEGE